MRKFFGLLAAVLALMAIALFVAGCSKQESSGNGKKSTLKLWSHQNEVWNISNEKLIAGFQKENPNITIEYEAFPYGDFEQKTQTSLISKSGGADIYEIWGGWVLDFAPTNALAPVPDSFINTLKQDSYEMVLAGFEYGGNYYGVPIELNQEGSGLLVLKPWFEEHGIVYPKTWNEMINIARKYRVYNNDGTFTMEGFDFINDSTLTKMYASMIVSKGGIFYENGKFNFDTPIAKEALQTLVDYVRVDHLCDIEAFLGGGFGNEYGVFNGIALMACKGFWTIPEAKEMYGSEYGVDFDYIALPFYGPEEKWVAETGWGYSVNASSQHLDEAWEFVKYCLRPENLIQLCIDRGSLPPQKSVATSSTYLAAVPFAKPIVDILDGVVYLGRINTEILKKIICDAFVDMVQNGTTVDIAAQKINSEIAKYTK
jgi:multiple sugar transport system substrate-binding protein